MHRTLLVAALGLAAAGVVVPATSASAVCIEPPTGGCLPCGAGVWNAAADRVNAVGEEAGLPVGLAHLSCLT